MARLSDEAGVQVENLSDHFTRAGRFEAAELLYKAVEKAVVDADRTATRGRPFPATYDSLARPGWFWIKSHRYWFGYFMDRDGAVVVHVFYDQSNIPGRLAP